MITILSFLGARWLGKIFPDPQKTVFQAHVIALVMGLSVGTGILIDLYLLNFLIK